MKKVFKVLALVLALSMVMAFAACGGNTTEETTAADETTPAGEVTEVKVGFIFLHDENSTYDKNFIDAAKAACEELGIEFAQKTQIPESNACYDAAVELIEVDGCNVIFADSFGHEAFLIQAAEQYKDVEFCHATGTQAHTAGLANFHNAFASIYEGRFLAGVAAGMKLNEMIDAGDITAEEAKMGYVGAFTFAEVISGYTSFYLGANGTMNRQKRKQLRLLSEAVVYLSASTQTQWVLPQLVKTQVFPTFHTTVQLLQLAPTHSSFHQESTGLPTSST